VTARARVRLNLGALFATAILSLCRVSAGPPPGNLAPSGASTSAAIVVGAPTFHPGDSFTFRVPSSGSEYEMTYKGMDAGLLVFHRTSGRFTSDQMYTPDLKLAEVRSERGDERFDPPVGYVEFPLFVGKKWSVTYKVSWLQDLLTANMEVLSLEEVEVPYGKVNAFRIRVRLRDRKFDLVNYETCWYSPEVRFFVKCERSKPYGNQLYLGDEFELLKVKR
jgi:hypothetical protein